MEQRSIQRVEISNAARWFALLVMCLGVLMIVVDGTIVNVALPTIRADLGFSESSLVWVVNAYMVPYSSFLLLFGRFADYYGHGRLFLLGIILFTLASLVCGTAGTAGLLVGARAAQGLGAAAVSAVSYSLIMQQFDGASERAQALAIYSSVAAIGGSAGVLLGGVLTHVLNWHWAFLINLPVGTIVCLLCKFRQFRADHGARSGRPDIGGAVTVTTSLTLAVLAILNAAKVGWWSTATLAPLCGALVSMAFFTVIELRAQVPIVPLKLFRQRNLSVSVVAGTLWAAATSTWAFISALYLQRVLGYDPLQVGLAFLPASVVSAMFALGVSRRLVMRFGVKFPLIAGLLCIVAGMTLFSRAPVSANFAADVLPGMLLLGLGGGIAYNPLILCALHGASEIEYGVASGVITSAIAMGGIVGLALTVALTTVSASHLGADGESHQVALYSNYNLAFIAAAVFAGGATLAGLCIDTRYQSATAPCHSQRS